MDNTLSGEQTNMRQECFKVGTIFFISLFIKDIVVETMVPNQQKYTKMAIFLV